MPAELCFDPSKVLQQDCSTKKSKCLETAAESIPSSAEEETSVDFALHQNVSGLMQPDGDHTENGQFSGELTEQDKLDFSESSSLSDFDLEHSESFSVRSDFVHSIENNEHSEDSMDKTSDQTVTEEHEPEVFILFQVMPELCMHYDQVDTEIQEPVLSDLEMVHVHETESEQSLEEDRSDESSEEISVSDLYEQYNGDQNAVFELDKELCEPFEQCELNNQNMPCECHTTHFESSEMCDASKESMPAGLPGCLVPQPPAGQIENTYDGELTAINRQVSCTDSFEGSVQSQISDDFAEQTLEQSLSFDYYTEHDFKTLEPCSSCGKYFEKCEIPEQCEPFEPAQDSEDSQQCKPFESSAELCDAFETQCSVFHTSELPRENPPIEWNTNEARKRPECDMMFIGSMETFETHWLAQFLAVDGHQNNTFEKQEVEDLDVALREPRHELLPCDRNAKAEPVLETLDVSSEQRMLCGECLMRENTQLNEEMPSQLFELCNVEAETFDLEYDEINAGESVVQEASTDECSEEEYADCSDGKSQVSTETDESFKSFIEEPEEICPVETDDYNPLHELHERDRCCTGQRQKCHEVFDGLNDTPDPHDEVEAHENIHESCSEPEMLLNGTYKTYAEVLCSGLYTEAAQSPKPCLEHAVPTDEEDYGLDEDTLAHVVEDQDPALFSEDEKYVESYGEMIVPDLSQSAGGIYGLPAEDESIYKSDASDPRPIPSTGHEQGISALEMYAGDECIKVSEVPEKFTEVPRLVENEGKHDPVSETSPDEKSARKNEVCRFNLSDDGYIKEENELEVINELEGINRPCCAEVETCEEAVADVEECDELIASQDPRDCAQDLPILQNAVELQSDQDLLKDPEQPGCCQMTETSEQKDDSPPQSACREKLDEIIHQVGRSETTEQSEPDRFFGLAGENPTSEEIEASEDTEASDDEDYPESCDCEYCVQPVEQVQCCRGPVCYCKQGSAC